MANYVDSPGSVEKERIRSEIDTQIREFLNKGGVIDTVMGKSQRNNNLKGSAWHNLDDEHRLVE